jgi:hypothetical protein
MKFLLALALAFLTAACAAPQPGTASHQRQLAEEARENFYLLKAQQGRPSRPIASIEAPAPKRARRQPSIVKQPTPARTRFAPARPAPRALRYVASAPRTVRQVDDTIYYYDVPHGPEPTSARYRAAKVQYARELSKRPQDLTSEEREWVRSHYRH